MASQETGGLQAIKGVIGRHADGKHLHVAGYEERNRRHLDTMQFETVLHARVPRVKNSDGSTSMGSGALSRAIQPVEPPV